MEGNFEVPKQDKEMAVKSEIIRLLADQSQRMLCYYDIESAKAKVLDDKICEDCQVPHLCENGIHVLLESDAFLPESTHKVKRMFEDIHNGVPQGDIRICLKAKEGSYHWFNMQYSLLYDGEKPESALITYKDITEEHKQELFALQQTQQIEENVGDLLLAVVCDFTTYRVEQIYGSMSAFEGVEDELLYNRYEQFNSWILDGYFRFDEYDSAKEYFSKEHLISQYLLGNKNLNRLWPVHFEGYTEQCWIDTKITIVEDPYSGHIKAFINIIDETAKRKEVYLLKEKSEKDSMTGLLNRATCENEIRSIMRSGSVETGVFMLVDLDNLKKINDTLGHEQGDRAILGITEVLKIYFGNGAVIGRIGGDEFIVFLPGEKEGSTMLITSISMLLQKLGNIFVGPKNEWRLHCSIGAVQWNADEDSFEEIYKKADIALYQVKRNSKNSYCFFKPEMVEKDHEFKKDKMFSLTNTERISFEAAMQLIKSVGKIYPLVLMLNFTTNNYCLLEGRNESIEEEKPFGTLEELNDALAKYIHPEDLDNLLSMITHESIERRYNRGRKDARCYFRTTMTGLVNQWSEANISIYKNDSGDLCCFLLSRETYDRKYDVPSECCQKMMKVAVKSTFEYICQIDITDGNYQMNANDGINTHNIEPSGCFEDATKYIRDNFVLPEFREEYYEQANLKTVVRHMNDNGGSYSYRYASADGVREASFYRFDSNQSMILMTVRKCDESDESFAAQKNLELKDVMLNAMSTFINETDTKTAMKQFLSIIGKYYEAERIYISEFDYNNEVINDIYEWYEDEYNSKINGLQDVPVSYIGDWLVDFRQKNAVCIKSVSNDISSLQQKSVFESQGITSLLAYPIYNGDELIGFIGADNPKKSGTDAELLRQLNGFITEKFLKKIMIRDMENMNYFDILTGVWNRNKFIQAMESYLQKPADSMGLFMIDIDCLVDINNQKGRDAGDRFICQCASAIKNAGADVFRVAGDEFILLLPDIAEGDFIQKESELRKQFKTLASEGISIGAVWTDEKISISELTAKADEMLSSESVQNSDNSRQQMSKYKRGMKMSVLEDIQNGKFEVVYQPQIDLKSGEIYGAEALVRKRDENGRFISPAKFVPFYEKEGLVSYVDMHVFEQVCAMMYRWRNRLGKTPKISVNLSYVTLTEPEIASKLSAVCEKFKVPYNCITIEVSENTDNLSYEVLNDIVHELKAAGFSVVLDDFGSMHSNVSILTYVDFECIKLDKSLIDKLGSDEKNTNLIKKLIMLCDDTLGTTSLAEGVETKEQMEWLKKFDCDYAQGYYCSRPVPASRFTAMLAGNRKFNM